MVFKKEIVREFKLNKEYLYVKCNQQIEQCLYVLYNVNSVAD